VPLKKHESGDLADYHNILNGWKNYFCQLLKVHSLNDVRQTGMYTADTLAHETSSFEVEITTEKQKRHINH